MTRALRRARHPQQAISEAIERLRSQGALDDERFASTFARVRLAHHGVGRNRIRAALRQKGVSREAAEQGLREALRERSEGDVLDAVARRLLRQESRDDLRKRLAKVYVALLRRGFPPSLVRERLILLRPETGDILDGYQFAGSEPPDEGGDPD